MHVVLKREGFRDNHIWRKGCPTAQVSETQQVGDLYIPGLLQGFLGSKHWMAELGKRGGTASTDAKATAARQNGKLGGRPRKSKRLVAA